MSPLPVFLAPFFLSWGVCSVRVFLSVNVWTHVAGCGCFESSSIKQSCQLNPELSDMAVLARMLALGSPCPNFPRLEL